MKVIFLDFDGVLNNDSTSYIFGYDNPKSSHFNQACPDATCVRLMDILLLKSNADIVVSSGWRLGTEVRDLDWILYKDFGLDLSNRVIDKTDNFYAVGEKRGHQIQRWLDQHPEVTHHVIIDDDPTACLDGYDHNIVVTNPSFGFQVDNMLKCLDYLGVERK